MKGLYLYWILNGFIGDKMSKNDRISSEQIFHDKKAVGIVENQDFYRFDITADLRDSIFNQMTKKNAIVLDYGCGSGWMSVLLARQGNHVIAIDISYELLKKAKNEQKYHYENYQTLFCEMNAEELGIKDGSVDYVIGNAILHHLDIKNSIDELHRILKVGGVCFFVEPLGHNPFINLYRKLTPHKRTVDERPFKINDLENLKNSFRFSRLEFSFLFSLIAFLWVFGLKNDYLFVKTLSALKSFDRYILRVLPFLRKYCWLSLIQVEK
ncbi:putative Methyltransferase type 11 [uncultured Desulfobacterium sp.]|uniref:Putative Methyltransferase type 11 n=1 Tax=uncultured Desulfobacterium sp. TaxID=201089 RepID=A0A445MZW8_9BACT|nr:putative Methyltransferase type 11 [uncultured Desulfobacterium sp.]